MSSAAPSDPPPARILFDAVLHPHRSLGATGFRILMAVVVAAGLVIGGVFLALGAWPVFGFFGLEILVLYLFFRANYRAARLYERVCLTSRDLTVKRVAARQPERTWTFQPYWLRVRMDDPPRHQSQVTLSSHGQTVVVGAFLSPEERLAFAKALNGALERWRHGPCEAAPVG